MNKLYKVWEWTIVKAYRLGEKLGLNSKPTCTCNLPEEVIERVRCEILSISPVMKTAHIHFFKTSGRERYFIPIDAVVEHSSGYSPKRGDKLQFCVIRTSTGLTGRFIPTEIEATVVPEPGFHPVTDKEVKEIIELREEGLTLKEGIVGVIRCEDRKPDDPVTVCVHNGGIAVPETSPIEDDFKPFCIGKAELSPEEFETWTTSIRPLLDENGAKCGIDFNATVSVRCGLRFGEGVRTDETLHHIEWTCLTPKGQKHLKIMLESMVRKKIGIVKQLPDNTCEKTS